MVRQTNTPQQGTHPTHIHLRRAHQFVAAHHSEEEQGTFPALADLDTTRDQAQRSYSGKVLHRRFLLYCESSADSYELARVLSCAGRMAGQWLQGSPRVAQQRLAPQVWRVAFRLWLGLPVGLIPAGKQQRCACCDAVVPLMLLVSTTFIAKVVRPLLGMTGLCTSWLP